ncbi:hypothetical protein AB5J62_23370 [Amycolatopsis sp. cg5]|uniref:hypothetical protein n=1 Tax=Amycolatopsis sp. cg5 TaxID=3238802 RepID=UPI0035233208
MTVAEAPFLAALLAGLGAQARAVADALPGLDDGETERDGRTCLDGGSAAVFGVGAPGGRVLDLQVRPDPVSTLNVQRWHGVTAAKGETTRRWERRLYLGHNAEAFTHAESIVDDRFAPLHARVGPFGRIYSVTEDPVLGPEIGWQFDRDVRVRDIVDPALWRLATPLLDDLHGFAVSRTAGPWSLAARFGPSGVRVSLGTSRWAYSVEDQAKRRRLAHWIDSLGGDGRHAEALYQLANGYRGDTRGVRIGRAAEVEVDLEAGQVATARAYLALPRKEDR